MPKQAGPVGGSEQEAALGAAAAAGATCDEVSSGS